MPKNVLAQKKNASSIQVLKTLKALMSGDYSMNELIDILNKNEPEAVFNNSVISKYINTCRFCGFEIPKINNKYYVTKIPFGLNLSDFDIDLIKSIKTYVRDEMSSRYTDTINSFFDKINRFSNKKIARVEKNDINISVELFERAVAKKKKVKLIFKNRTILECIPLSVSKINQNLYFNIFYKKVRNINFSRLTGVQITEHQFFDPFDGEQLVVFKLKGALAKRYEARNNESVQINNDGTITVTNTNENKEILFSRLLRYDDKCEILSPAAYREEMKNLICNMLNNYGVN